MSAKSKARMEMLKKMSSQKGNDLHDMLGKGLKGKKLQKVSVMSDSKEGLEKGLSLAEKIMKAKLGDKKPKSAEAMMPSDEDLESMADEDCAECHDEGCPACSEDEESDEE